MSNDELNADAVVRRLVEDARMMSVNADTLIAAIIRAAYKVRTNKAEATFEYWNGISWIPFIPNPA